MDLYKLFLGLAGVLVGGAIAGMMGGWEMFVFALVLAGIGFLLWGYLTFVWIRVPEMAVFVIFNRETKAFSRFLYPGRHLIGFPLEYVAGEMSLMPNSVDGTCQQAQTHGGISIGADWSLTYRLNPAAADEGLRPIVARFMTDNTRNFFRRHANNCLQEIFSRYTIETLSAEGMLPRLQVTFQRALAERLRPFGVEVFRVMVGSLSYPPHVQAMLEAAREREIYAESQARMLTRLRLALSEFSDVEMERLLRLEQLRELGKNGVLMQVPWMQTIVQPPQSDSDQPRNGRSRDNIIYPNPPEDNSGDGRSQWPPTA